MIDVWDEELLDCANVELDVRVRLATAVCRLHRGGTQRCHEKKQRTTSTWSHSDRGTLLHIVNSPNVQGRIKTKLGLML